MKAAPGFLPQAGGVSMRVCSQRVQPTLIQGGMGVAVSDWRLARAVSRAGQLGVVSGVAIDTVLARRLQLGDPGGHMRRALAAFPLPAMADRVVERFFVSGGVSADESFAPTHALSEAPTQEELELVVVANFVEVYLAKEGHAGWVGVNYLEKIQTPTLPSLFGAMLAGVDYVLMGAGIPRTIPGVLDRLAEGLAVEAPLAVAGASSGERFLTRFDPEAFCGVPTPKLNRPQFLAIVASATLASMLVRKSNGRVDGFIVEGPTAGGHNAPPRGKPTRNERGEPVYGPRDEVDLGAIAALGRPFWLAGSCGSPEGLRRAREAGAAGVQVGTAFAFCEESGFRPDLRDRLLESVRAREQDVLTDPLASPTGFPLKVLQVAGSMSDREVYESRNRVCDVGYLRQAYRREDGTLGWRCPGEPVAAFLRKGGGAEETLGRKCVCNGLLADVGLEQRRGGRHEPPLVTCGNDVASIRRLQPESSPGRYTASDVIDHVLAGLS